ncbi:MAG: adenylate kinase [Methanomassiliicoccales archaeon]|nr:MAG: adenylate kinase [Methanomassiliicoccales archaeon]
MRMVVTGVPGVGKTSVMEGVAKEKGLAIVNYGTVMFEVARAEGLVENRDQIRKLPVEVQRVVQEKAAQKIYEVGDVIIDTHCTIKTIGGYYPGLPEWVLRKLKPHRILLVEATKEEIAKRRGKDESRTRDKETNEEIEEHQMMNRYAAMAYSMLSGASIKIVFNHDGGLEAAIKEVLKVF